MVASTSSGSSRTGASTGCAPAKTESPYRSRTEPSGTLRAMATNSASEAHGGSFLLELLYFAAWWLELRDARTIRAIHGEVQVEVSGATRPVGGALVLAPAV